MFTLRYPFSLPPGQEIAVTEESTNVGDLNFSLKRQDRLYILTISGFNSEEEAKQYINNVWAGLMWLLLHHGLSPNAELEAQKVTYTEDPYQAARNISKNFGLQVGGPVDGLIDGARPAVYPSEKNIRTLTVGQAAVIISTPVSAVFSFLSEGVSYPRSGGVNKVPKLRLALELYSAYYTETSANARFLTLVMALEALSSGVARTPLVIGLLDKWKSELGEVVKTVDLSSDDAASLKAMGRELSFRKEDSIRMQIRNVVLTTLQASGDQDAGQTAKDAVKIYDLRSTLVHEGKLEQQVLSKATSDAKIIVERVLRARFIQEAN